MTLQYQFNNVTLPAATGLPTPVARLATVLALSGIAGIYMFEDGAIGSSITTALDVSGLNNHGVLRTATGYVTPTRTALGAAIPVGDSTHSGVVFDTPIARTDAETGFTAIYGYKNAAVENTSGVYPAFGIIDSSLAPGPNAAYTILSNGPIQVARGMQYTGGNHYEGGALVDPNGKWFTGGATKAYPPAADGQAYGLWDLFAAKLDTVAKTISTYKNGAIVTNAQALVSGFTAPPDQGKFCFGNFLASSGGDSTIRPQGQLAFVVICTQPNTDAAIQAACATLTSVMLKRGATFGQP